MVMANVAPLAERMSFIGEGDSVAPGVTGMDAFGHTPGHMVFNVESGGKRLMLTADTANHFVLSLQRPDWEVVFDSDKAMGAAARKKVFDMIAADRIPFIGYHMPFPSVGYVEKMDVGYRYIPETYQLDL
jgi:glyoxylase-like metal-dependent hydrolase (beta-lactamase superfamily II)